MLQQQHWGSSEWQADQYHAQSLQEAAAGSVAARGLCFANTHPAPTRFLPLKKSSVFMVQRAARANHAALLESLWSNTGRLGFRCADRCIRPLHVCCHWHCAIAQPFCAKSVQFVLERFSPSLLCLTPGHKLWLCTCSFIASPAVYATEALPVLRLLSNSGSDHADLLLPTCWTTIWQGEMHTKRRQQSVAVIQALEPEELFEEAIED